jgi:NAD(P)-dependent dehydrogenase (short-subunit alcohol dehydrogenase family)
MTNVKDLVVVVTGGGGLGVAAARAFAAGQVFNIDGGFTLV